MAEFCAQCSHKLGFRNELAGLLDLEDLISPDELCVQVVCEGCGITYVNNEGECVMPGCLAQHVPPQEKHNTREAAPAAERK